jgi:hypothetical protein
LQTGTGFYLFYFFVDGGAGVCVFSGGSEKHKERSKIMKNPLDSVTGTIISGFILTLILYFIVSALI